MSRFVSNLHRGEDGHALPLLGSMIAGAGAIVLALGAVNDNDAVTIAGGVVAAVGLLAYDFLHHTVLDHEFFRRTTK